MSTGAHARSLAATWAPMIAAILLCVCLGPNCLQAQEGDPDLQSALDRGNELFKQKAYGQAVQEWRQAFRSSRGDYDLKFAGNLGIALFKLEDYQKAYYYFSYFQSLCREMDCRSRAEELGLVSPDKVQKALEIIEGELASSMTRITIDVAPDATEVCFDEETDAWCFRPPVVFYLDPGEHTVYAKWAGRPVVAQAISVGAGPMEPVVLRLPEAGPEEIPELAAAQEASSDATLWKALLFSAGCAAVVGGGIVLYLAYDSKSGIDDEAVDKVATGQWTVLQGSDWLDKSYGSDVVPGRDMSVILLATGGAALAGFVLWNVVDGSWTTEDGGLSVAPLVFPGGGIGLGMDMGF